MLADETYTSFALGMLEASHRILHRAIDDLPEKEWYYRPSPDTNSIAWLAWHLSRWKDRVSALAVDEPQIWVSGGWAGQFGIPEERTGLGDSPEQVAAFHPERTLLLRYVDAAQEATLRRVHSISQEQLTQPIEYMPGGDKIPLSRALLITAMDFSQHTGRIAYLRGLLTGKGWFRA